MKQTILWLLAFVSLAAAINVSLGTGSYNSTTPVNLNWFFSNFSINTRPYDVDTIIFQSNSVNKTIYVSSQSLLLYSFENVSGIENNTRVRNWADKTGMYGNGTVIGGNQTNTGYRGKGLQFLDTQGSTRQYLSVNISTTPLQNYTFSAWFKAHSIASVSAYGSIIETGSGTQFLYLDDGKIVLYEGTPQAGTTIIQNATWYNTILTVNSTHSAVFLNGNLEIIRAKTTDSYIGGGANFFLIGGRLDATWNFNGTIDEVTLINHSLTQTELKDYSETITQVTSSLNWLVSKNYSQATAWNYTYSLWVNDSTSASNQTANAYAVFNTEPNFYRCLPTHANNSLNYFVKDAETNASINSNVTAQFTATKSDGTTNLTIFTNNTNLSICFTPSWATPAYSNLIFVYPTGAYSNSTYLYSGTAANNSLNTTLPLYSGDITIVYVLDEVKYKIIGAVIEAYKVYPDGSSFLIGSQLTDAEGKAIFYLRPYVDFYKFIITYNGQVNAIGSTIIACTGGTCPPYTLTLNIRTQGASEYFTLLNQVNSTCAVNASSFLVCQVIDGSGLVTRFNLFVEKKGAIIFTEVCNQSITAASGTLYCSLGNLTNTLFRYRVLYYASPEDTSTWALIDNLTGSFSWGSLGIIIALFIILVVFFSGIFNPSVSIISSYFAVVVCWTLGLLPADLMAVIGLGVAVGVIIWRIGL